MFNTVVNSESLPRMKYERLVERFFVEQRGTPGFIFSPGDWRILEAWKDSGIPLPVVLRGVESAFRQRMLRAGNVNSLAFCSPRVMAEWRKYRERVG